MMLRVFLVASICVLNCLFAAGQVRLPVYPDSIFPRYFHQRASLFNLMPTSKDDIIFIGNSITDGNEWSELFDDTLIKNRGISGDITSGILYRISKVASGKPAKVFLMIGINDLARGVSADTVIKNILLAVAYLQQESPSTSIFVQSILPVNRSNKTFNSHTSKKSELLQVNRQLKEKAEKNGYSFIDLNPQFSNQDGDLKEEFTNDGLHLKGAGYLLWKHLVFPYVYDLSEQPALIPQPRELTWGKEYFPLYLCEQIVYDHTSLSAEAGKLKEMLPEPRKIKLTESQAISAPHILLRLDPSFTAPQYPDEAYHLEVKSNRVTITARTAHGIFNAIQTFRQLIRDKALINTCNITDWPSFSYRAFMTDAGRNYQSMDMLKEQIRTMASYKFNVFHFHATEDIAWRIAVKQFPQLTAPEHMLRNKGMYYSESEIKELIRYCAERYITFVPEIDMPGHSEAFHRAMKTTMQTDSGMAIVKQILNEFMDTYDLPYMHIGADEVKITNREFVPQMTTLIEKRGRKVIGWEPGGNFNESTIRQLWMDDNAKITDGNKLKFIDSRHLYINHMDPLESVVTIFARRIGGRVAGDSIAMGGTLCVWHDRAVAKESDMLTMNPVYPSMLAFAERAWRGGGWEGKVSNVGDIDGPLAKEFAAFERRLLDHKTQYFQHMPFPYAKQSQMTWELYGPYQNNGALDRKFQPEMTGIKNLKPAQKANGGTIILRHWWAPTVSGTLSNPTENSTWYASTGIWSAEDKEVKVWIGFNNISRSPATDSPLPGTWDNHQSKVWVNGQEILPPQWLRGGQKGNSEIPLSDEGYEYRAPALLQLKKGWNDVLVKAPIGSFKGRNWQNPEKWMFTFLVLD